jgi:folate-binding protein YgfZ
MTNDPASIASTHAAATPDDYTMHRMLLGVPEGFAEIIPGQALPLESCMDIHGGGECSSFCADFAVDFRKGCYLGQELTVRTYHTGATRKRILPIRLFPLGPDGLGRPIYSLHAPPTHEPDLQPPSQDIIAEIAVGR